MLKMKNKLICSLFLVLGTSIPTFAHACSAAVKDGNGNIITPSTCIIFVTNVTHSGAMGGYNGADASCQSEALERYPALTDTGITFKALLAFNHATQINIEYYRPDGRTLIAKAAGPNLARTLTNPILNSATPGNISVWTGMVNSMSQYDSMHTCAYWNNYNYKTNNITHDYYGYYGYADIAGEGWDAGSQSTCRTQHYLICVAQ